MDQIFSFFSFLFGTREGVFCLIGGGVIFFLLIAAVLEYRGRKIFVDRGEEKDEDWDEL